MRIHEKGSVGKRSRKFKMKEHKRKMLKIDSKCVRKYWEFLQWRPSGSQSTVELQ